MPEIDKIFHRLFNGLDDGDFKWNLLYTSPSTVHYYYAEDRLYVFRFEDKTYAFSKGWSPVDAFRSWLENSKIGINSRFEKEVQ